MNQNAEIRLRAIEPEDVELLYGLENMPELWDVGITNVPYSKFALTEYITSVTYDIYKDQQVRLIAENADGEVVGVVDITNFDPKHSRAELDIVILKAYRGKGLATTVVSEMCKYAASTLHLHQLYVIIDADNIAARRLFLKTRFEGELVLRDWLYDGKNYRNAIMLQTFL